MQMERRKEFIRVTEAWTNSIFKRQNCMAEQKFDFAIEDLERQKTQTIGVEENTEMDSESFCRTLSNPLKALGPPLLDASSPNKMQNKYEQTTVDEEQVEDEKDPLVNDRRLPPSGSRPAAVKKEPERLTHMELRIFDDDFLDQQLKEIDQRTKELLKMDTSNAPPQHHSIKKPKLPYMMKPTSQSASNLTLDMRALT